MINAVAFQLAVSCLHFTLWACKVLTCFFLVRFAIELIYQEAFSCPGT